MPNLQSLLDSQKQLVGVRVNFVVNAEGRFVGESGSSRDISNDEDLAVLKKLRSLSDVIITDATTARTEKYSPSKWAPIQVWSRTGNFAGIAAVPGLSLELTPDAFEKITTVAREYPHVLLETGPTLTRELAKSATIDELKLTVIGGRNPASSQEIATKVAASLGLSYLKLRDSQQVQDSWFLTLGR